MQHWINVILTLCLLCCHKAVCIDQLFKCITFNCISQMAYRLGGISTLRQVETLKHWPAWKHWRSWLRPSFSVESLISGSQCFNLNGAMTVNLPMDWWHFWRIVMIGDLWSQSERRRFIAGSVWSRSVSASKIKPYFLAQKEIDCEWPAKQWS